MSQHCQTGPRAMETQVKPLVTPAYRFGPYHVDAAAGQLRKNGTKIRLAGHPFDILVMLLEREGQVVTREEIKQRLWPTAGFGDFENGLNKAINKLRQALADSAERPLYVETLPRRGYRFIATVELRQDHSNGTEKKQLVTAVAERVVVRFHFRGISLLFWIGAGTLAVSLFAVVVARMIPAPRPRVLRSTVLTNSARIDRWGRLQTDGTRLFFLERQGHHWTLMQMPAPGGERQPFSEPFQNTRILAISSDGSEMIVTPFKQRTDSLELWLMSTVGGLPRRLGTVIALDAVFGPEPQQITYSRLDGIYIVGREGLNARKLVSLNGIKRALGWSPDGRILRFELHDLEDQTSTIWEFDRRSGDPHPMLPGWDDQPLQISGRWTADGRYYIFVSGNHGGSQNIWALSQNRRAGLFSRRNEPVELNTGPVKLDQPLPTKDGRRLFALGSNERSEYVRYDLKTRDYQSLFGGAASLCTSFSHDGDWVVSCSGNALWLSKPDGSSRRELASEWFNAGGPQISPDGKEVAFQGTPRSGGPSRIYVVSVDGGAPQELVAEAFSAAAPYWSPDASALVYTLPTEAGAGAGAYVIDRKTSVKTKLPDSAGFWKVNWSPNGKFLAAVQEDNHRIAMFDKISQRWTEICKGAVIGPPVWSADSRYIYYQDVLEQGEPVHRVNIKTKKTEQVFDCGPLLKGVQRCGFEDITPDGALVFRLTRGDHDVYALDLELP
ncbi:MAG TPA: winged helix-turn-helix domain-containing protein [Candidatus Acidoferrum sp.]|nr:winged helix-turn-helix domain-containing protein [Candidatus Acidoferrum sp.]